MNECLPIGSAQPPLNLGERSLVRRVSIGGQEAAAIGDRGQQINEECRLPAPIWRLPFRHGRKR